MSGNEEKFDFTPVNGMYFTPPLNKYVTVKYLYKETAPNHFDKGKTMLFRYHLQVNGYPKVWDRASKELAKIMSEISDGSFIVILRTGEGNKTKYKITRIIL